MSEQPRRRVLVALHPGDEPGDALDFAAALAFDLGGELMGLFVEDQTLFDLCGMEAVEVSRSTGATRRLEPDALARQLRATAGAARSRLSKAAAERRVAWSFEVRRERVCEAVFAATERAELVVASRASLGASAFPRGGRRAGPVVALLDGRAGESATLEAAARAAQRLGAPLVGLVVGGRAGERSLSLAGIAGRLGVAVELRHVEDDPERIARSLAEASPRLLALGAHSVAADRAELGRYLAAAGSAAMFVGTA